MAAYSPHCRLGQTAIAATERTYPAGFLCGSRGRAALGKRGLGSGRWRSDYRCSRSGRHPSGADLDTSDDR